jgi:hypothetical protein
MKQKYSIVLTIVIVAAVIGVTTAFCAYSYAWKKAEAHYFLNDRSYIELWNDTILDNDSTYNYDVLRDLLLPSHYSNDTATIQYGGYENGSVYYINHTDTNFRSVYFNDSDSYRIVIPLIGRVFLLEE